jgi:hypothetical protein
VTVPVVDIVDVIIMGHGDVPAVRTVDVVMVSVLLMPFSPAFIDMVAMHGVHVTVVGVVGVVAVGNGNVSASLTVDVGMVGVLGMGSCHACSSFACRIAAWTIWPTWASAS